MATFKLVCKESNYTIKESDSLKSIFEHIQFYIDKPENYQIEEYHCVDACSAKFLIEKFKNPEDVPLSILDI
jgi:hypothetical protein